MKYFFTLTSLLFLFSCTKQNESKPIINDIKELVFASGELQWDNAYNLTAQTDGILQNTNFEIGDKVTKGKIIATIDNEINNVNAQIAQEQLTLANENISTTAPALLQLEQNIQFAESKYLQDKKHAERYENLNQQKIGTQVEYENSQLNAKNSLSNLNALKKQYKVILQQAKQLQIANKGQVQNNKIIQKYNKLLITESGTIIKKLKTKGDYVRKGEVIAVIADEQKVEAVLNIDENNIGKIKIGQLVFIKLNTDKNTIYNGKISEILSAFDEQTQSFICKVIFDKTLKTSLFGTQLEANVLVAEKKKALLIARDYMGYGNIVNVKGKEESVIIKSGIISTDFVEVLEGINKDDVLLPLKP